MHAAHVSGQVIEMSQGGSTNRSPRVSGRDFLKLMAAAGIIMTFAPFVDWGKFLPNTQIRKSLVAMS
jgi:hypothetical protein